MLGLWLGLDTKNGIGLLDSDGCRDLRLLRLSVQLELGESRLLLLLTDLTQGMMGQMRRQISHSSGCDSHWNFNLGHELSNVTHPQDGEISGYSQTVGNSLHLWNGRS